MKKLIVIMFFGLLPFTLQAGIAVSENRIASRIGADILRQGGNAIDAAVAVGYALAVVEPCCGNIGGGGFMTIKLQGQEPIFLNFREKAPLAAKPDYFVKPDASIEGYLAVGVPGTVLGFETIQRKYGKLSRQKLLKPAIQLAKDGFIVSPYLAHQFQKFAPDFAKEANVARIFLKNGKPYPAHSLLKQEDLAQTLTKIADSGAGVFYHGSISAAIVNASDKHGGILSAKDFAQYTVEILKPVHCRYHGFDIYSAPPPSSGGTTLCELLAILEYFPLKQMGYHSAKSTQVILEAMRHAFIDRNNLLGDPDFVPDKSASILAKSHIQSIVKMILQTERNIKRQTFKEPELTDTTHYSIIDNAGNAVATTYTINGFYGAKVIAGNTGFFLNNEMDDFTTRPGDYNKFGLVQSNVNAIAPGKRPLSSMAPTIVTRHGKVVMILGSPGGPRIITTLLQTLLNLLVYDMTLTEAINAPRFHYQGAPDVVDLEPNALGYHALSQLSKLNYHFMHLTTWGAVSMIYFDPSVKSYIGFSDKRRPDGGAAYSK